MKAWRVAPMPKGWAALRQVILDRDQYTCRLAWPGCLGVATDVDHTVPACEGGSDDPSNLMAVCRRCHRSKTGQEAARRRRPRSRNRKPEAHPGLR